MTRLKEKVTPAASAELFSKGQANITGVDLRVPSANYLKLFAALGVKRVGVVYRPDQNGAYLSPPEAPPRSRGSRWPFILSTPRLTPSESCITSREMWTPSG